MSAATPRPAAGPTGPERLRFGDFVLHLDSGELWHGGVRVRLEPQPAKVLELLARRTGEVVSRSEIQRRVWGDDTFVDFDQGLNYCVKQIRRALGERAGAPRFVETVPRRGYRFLPPVTVESAGPPRLGPAGPGAPAAPRRLAGSRWAWTVSALLLAAALLALWLGRRPAPVGRGSGPGGPPRLAVLPFERSGPALGDEVLADGLTEELIGQLARRHGRRMGVIARSSAMRYKGSGKSGPEIGRELGADYVLEGSLRRAGERVRLTAHLVRTADATELWAGAWERRVGDLLAWQREVGEEVAAALPLPAGWTASAAGSAEAAVEAAARPSPKAYEAYLKGLYHLRRPGGAGTAAATAELEEALRLDPGFAPAHAALARARLQAGGTPLEVAPGAEAAARAALALDPDHAEAHLTLALIRLYVRYDWSGAEQHFAAALSASPAHAEVRHHYAGYLAALGRHEEALAEVAEARRLDPVSVLVEGDAAWYLLFARRYREAAAQAREALDLEPHDPMAHRVLLAALVLAGDEAGALAHARSLASTALPGGDTAGATGTFPDLAAFRRWQLATLEDRGRRRHVPPSESALVHLALGEEERALDLLAESCRQHCGLEMPFLAVDPRLDPVRSDPRFHALLDCIRLPADAPARAVLAAAGRPPEGRTPEPPARETRTPESGA